MRVELGDGVGAAVSDRRGGVSVAPYDERNLGGLVGDEPDAVRANRARTQAELGVAGIALMRQVHGADVRYVTRQPDDEPLDAMFTDVPGLAIGVLVADCAPVLIADPVNRLVGGAHSGRPGTVAGVV